MIPPKSDGRRSLENRLGPFEWQPRRWAATDFLACLRTLSRGGKIQGSLKDTFCLFETWLFPRKQRDTTIYTAMFRCLDLRIPEICSGVVSGATTSCCVPTSQARWPGGRSGDSSPVDPLGRVTRLVSLWSPFKATSKRWYPQNKTHPFVILSSDFLGVATYGCGSKPMVQFWGRCTTHFGMFTGGTGHGHIPFGPPAVPMDPSSFVLTIRRTPVARNGSATDARGRRSCQPMSQCPWQASPKKVWLEYLFLRIQYTLFFCFRETRRDHPPIFGGPTPKTLVTRKRMSFDRRLCSGLPRKAIPVLYQVSSGKREGGSIP